MLKGLKNPGRKPLKNQVETTTVQQAFQQAVRANNTSFPVQVTSNNLALSSPLYLLVNKGCLN
jgi:hypothetical protein